MGKRFVWISTTSSRVCHTVFWTSSEFADLAISDAQFFPISEIRKLVGTPKGSELSESDLKLLDKASSGSNAKSDQETANALAPSERKDGEGKREGDGKGLTRVPPDTAIAGQLIRLWASGGIDKVSRL
jgi:NAD+ diphosphatase